MYTVHFCLSRFLADDVKETFLFKININDEWIILQTLIKLLYLMIAVTNIQLLSSFSFEMKTNFKTSPVHIEEGIQTSLVISLDRHSASLLEDSAQVGCGQPEPIKGQYINKQDELL